MSTITPPSFLDDGVSIKDRLPQGLDTQRVAKWVSRGTFSETSEYTGSFVDDDEDMVLHGGGMADRQSRYENEEARKNKDGEHVWNENAKKAVSGDVRRHVDKIRDLRGKVQVRKVKEMDKVKEKVFVPVPQRWGTFVIKDKDGRVVVVDDEGEFDSGPQEVYDGGKQHERRWVRAASTIKSLSPLPLAQSTVLPPPDQYMGAGGFTEGAETAKKGREKDMWNCIPNSPRPLSPIPESEDEGGSSSTSKESIRSQTDFMAAVTNWRDYSQASTTGHNRSSRGSITEDRGWISPSKLPHPFTWATSPSSNTSKRWNRDPKAADDPEWTDSETSSFQQDGFDGPAYSFGEATWDGFERHKTLSDVSIAGSNSIRSSLLESVRSHHSTAMSRRRGTSREEVRVDNQHGWEHGSSGTSNGGYASSSDEDNATYRSANWGETTARVAKD